VAGQVVISIRADPQDAVRGFAKTTEAAEKTHSSITKMGAAVASFAGNLAARAVEVFASHAVDGLKSIITAASDLNETVSKSRTIWGAQGAAIEQWANTAATAFGLSKQEALEGAASFGNFFAQIGIGTQQAAAMSKKLVELSGDFGSFNNADPAQVMEALQSATRGEFDALQRFVPTVSAATVEAQALADTHKKTAKALTDAEKATALYELVLKGAGPAVGDYARTSDGLANTQRSLTKQVTDLQASIGTALLPAVVAVASTISTKLLPGLAALWQEHAPQVTAIAQTLADKFKAWASSVDWDALSAKVGGFFAGLTGSTRGVDGVAQSFAKVGEQIRTFFQDLSSGASGNSEVNKTIASLKDSLDVFGVAISFAADHADLLAKALPVLAIAFGVAKVANIAANIAAVAEVPTKIASIAANRALTASNRELAASHAAAAVASEASTAATVANTAATSTGILAKIRDVAATVAQRIASIAGAAATGVMTAAQWLLDAALAANPIGLVIIAIVALIAGLVLLYQHSETARAIMDAVWSGIKIAAQAVADFFMAYIMPQLKSFWSMLVALWNGGVATVKAIWSGLLWLGSFISGVVATVRGVIDAVMSFIVSKVTEAVNRWISVWNTVVNVVHTIEGVRDKIVGVFAGAASWLYDAGRKVIQGLLDGIEALIGRVKSKLSEVTSLIPDWKGPPTRDAKLLYDNGRLIMQGLIGGITSQTPWLNDALSTITDTISNTSATLDARVLTAGTINTSGMPVNSTINVNVPVSADPSDIGRQIIKAVQQYEKATGRQVLVSAT
jgi:hypothetical protein